MNLQSRGIRWDVIICEFPNLISPDIIFAAPLQSMLNLAKLGSDLHTHLQCKVKREKNSEKMR